MRCIVWTKNPCNLLYSGLGQHKVSVGNIIYFGFIILDYIIILYYRNIVLTYIKIYFSQMDGFIVFHIWMIQCTPGGSWDASPRRILRPFHPAGKRFPLGMGRSFKWDLNKEEYTHISKMNQNDPNISINHQVWNFCQACLRLWLRKALLYDLVGRQCLLRPGGRQVLPGSWEGHTCISFRPEICYFEPPGVYIFQMIIDINGDNDD